MRVIAIIRRLFQYAEDKAGTIEGDSYRVKAHQLLARYGLTREDIFGYGPVPARAKASLAPWFGPTWTPRNARVGNMKNPYRDDDFRKALKLGPMRTPQRRHDVESS